MFELTPTRCCSYLRRPGCVVQIKGVCLPLSLIKLRLVLKTMDASSYQRRPVVCMYVHPNKNPTSSRPSTSAQTCFFLKKTRAQASDLGAKFVYSIPFPPLEFWRLFLLLFRVRTKLPICRRRYTSWTLRELYDTYVKVSCCSTPSLWSPLQLD